MDSILTEVEEALSTTSGLSSIFSFDIDIARIIAVILIVVVGLFLIKFLVNFTQKFFERTNVDKTLRKFFLSAMQVALYILLGIIVASSLGFDMTSLVAIFSVVGVAMSLALQGSLSNLAGGVMLLLNKPFSIGDFIEIAGTKGHVHEIGLAYTKLHTLDKKLVYIPNSEVSGQQIINYSAEDLRHLEITFSIGYADDITKAKAIINNVIASCPYAILEPTPLVKVNAHGENSIDILTRTWVKNPNYFELQWYLLEYVKNEFDAQGITIPYPQMDVHINA